MLMPCRSWEMRSKKTCSSWQWIWSMFSVGFTLAVGSRVWLSPQSSTGGCRLQTFTSLPATNRFPMASAGPQSLPLWGITRSLAGCRDRGKDGWAPGSPQGLLQPIHGPHPSSQKQPSYPHVLWLSSVTAWCTAGHWCTASAFVEFLIGNIGNP